MFFIKAAQFASGVAKWLIERSCDHTATATTGTTAKYKNLILNTMFFPFPCSCFAAPDTETYSLLILESAA
jgi:hypothetical protein